MTRVADLEVEVERLRLEPGDKVLVHLSEPLSPDRARKLTSLLGDLFAGHEVLVLNPGTQIELVPDPWREALK